MSLPRLSAQSPLFATVTTGFFAAGDRYRLFAEKVFPLLLRARAALEGAYSTQGRPGLEPAVLAGVTSSAAANSGWIRRRCWDWWRA
jgi:hypothetical protein